MHDEDDDELPDLFEEEVECSDCGRLLYDPEFLDPPVCKPCARAQMSEDDEDEDEDEEC